MAELQKRNGSFILQIVKPDGHRATFTLGKSRKAATITAHRIESLLAAKMQGAAPDRDTSAWLAGVSDKLRAKLVKAGLAEPQASSTLGDFTRRYIDGRHDIKASTRLNLERCRSYLLEHFDAQTPLRDVTEGDADDFRQHMVKAGRSENTTRRAIGRARQFFNAAKKRRFIDANPFEHLAASVRANRERFAYIDRQTAQKVIDACPDAQWRLMFVLARFGGLRTPSETLSLKWGHIDWANGRIVVPSPKTAHHEGKAQRMLPLFPELVPYLREVFEQAEAGEEYVITRYRDTAANLRTQLQRFIRAAGVQPWPKLWQNLRSTRETELAETFPGHVVCQWIGNSQPIAAEHYLQVTDEHFKRAVQGDAGTADRRAARALQQPTADKRTGLQPSQRKPRSAAACSSLHNDATLCESKGLLEVPPPGLEPGTR